MIKYFMSKTYAERAVIGIIACVILFGFSYFYVLNYVSVMESPPLGNTIYIMIGSTLSIVSALAVLVLLKNLYNYKKKKERKNRSRKQHKLFYLKDSKKDKKSE
jgi:cobalamin synthase